jgi:putative AdoMet-dependent methyltransferase
MKKATHRNVSDVEFVCSGFLTTDARENHYDAIVTQIALNHLAEFWKMIAIKKMYSALKSGGKLLLIDCILSFDVNEYVHHVNGYIEMVKNTAGPQKANDVVLNIKDEYPAFDWVIETMLFKAGFTIDKISRFNGYIASFLCTK